MVLTLLAACNFGAHATGTPDSSGTIDAEVDAEVPGQEVMQAPPLCDPTNASLRVCFTFEDSLQDGSQFNNDITASLTPVYTTGRPNAGKALTTTAGTFTTPSNTTLDMTMFTMRLWIHPNAIPTGGARAGLIDSGSRFRLFLQSDGALRCAVTNGIDLTTTTGKVTQNQWQRVTCRYDGNVMTIYVDGTMVGTKTQTSIIPSLTGGMVVGHNNPSGENLVGAIDDVQIFNTLVAP